MKSSTSSDKTLPFGKTSTNLSEHDKSTDKTSFHHIDSLEKIIVWLKTVKNPSFPKFFNSSMHLYKENTLLLVTRNQASSSKLSILLINLTTFSVEDKFFLSNDDVTERNFDTMFLHPQSVLFHNRLYLIKNSSPSDNENVFIGDLSLKKLLSIKSDETRPACFRINYTMNLHQFKLLFFGGIQVETMTPLNILDSFDILTYRWELIKTKGKSPDPRHSHSAIVINDTLYIIGGTNSRDLFHSEGKLDDLFLLDLKNYCWTPIKTFGTIPKYLGYNYACAINERRIFVLWSERGFNEAGFELQTSMLDLVNYEWEEALIFSKKPDYRFNAGFCYDNNNKSVLFYGGFYFNKNEMNCFSNELDRLRIIDKNEYEGSNQIEVYNGEKIDMKNLNSLVSNRFENSPKDGNRKKNEDLIFDDEELSFEELLEREKKLQEEEKTKDDEKKVKKKKPKKKKDKKKN